MAKKTVKKAIKKVAEKVEIRTEDERSLLIRVAKLEQRIDRIVAAISKGKLIKKDF